MVRNHEKVLQAITFRKRGFTLAEIAKICEVSKSTVSVWLKSQPFSETVTAQNQRRARYENGKRLKLVNKARTSERNKRYQEAEHSAVIEYRHYKHDVNFIAGLIAYQACGDRKATHTIRISSTDQQLSRIFLRFCFDYLGVSKEDVRIWLLLYKDQPEERCVRSWSRVTKLPLPCFGKTQFLRQSTQRQPLHSGVGNTIIGSTALKRKLAVWLDLAQKDLVK